MTKALVLHSGGIDSSVALVLAITEYGASHVCSLAIDYGQRHVREMDYAQKFCEVYGIERRVVKLPPIQNSLLTDPTKEIPNTSYDQIEGVSPMYVPFRNGLMLANAASIAQAEGFSTIYYGAHAEDAFNWAYPDCTPEFNGAMANAIYVGTYHKVRLVTPLQWLLKWQIVAKGAELRMPFLLTWSCYKGEDIHCGTCATCRARKAAFVAAGIPDPTTYKE